MSYQEILELQNNDTWTLCKEFQHRKNETPGSLFLFKVRRQYVSLAEDAIAVHKFINARLFDHKSKMVKHRTYVSEKDLADTIEILTKAGFDVRVIVDARTPGIQ